MKKGTKGFGGLKQFNDFYLALKNNICATL
jgi:hypothetical protein